MDFPIVTSLSLSNYTVVSSIPAFFCRWSVTLPTESGYREWLEVAGSGVTKFYGSSLRNFVTIRRPSSTGWSLVLFHRSTLVLLFPRSFATARANLVLRKWQRTLLPKSLGFLLKMAVHWSEKHHLVSKTSVVLRRSGGVHACSVCGSSVSTAISISAKLSPVHRTRDRPCDCR